MCGIAGTIGFADADVIARMGAALRHRGPDDEGVLLRPDAPFALGHRRLSIIDLSPAGHQPMGSVDGRLWVVFNGEIYNYRDLRAELQGRGCEFRTGSDTEVVLAAYAVWGEDCLDRFRGMFAFALADLDNRSVFLARDRFGIKPLVHAAVPGGFLFASELRALTASGRLQPRLDRQAVWDYLSLGAVAPPRTVLSGVQALPPGHAMRVAFDGTVQRIWRWWDILSAAAVHADEVAKLGFAAAAERLRVELDDATRCHLVADVPVGAFLSGGVDSAAVVGLMSRQAGGPIRTFTVGFETRDADLSEIAAARQTAAHFSTRHCDVVIGDADAAAAFEPLIEALDQPSMDGANTYFVARATAPHVKVALSGLGGDELFAGYPHFRRHAIADRVSRFGGPLVTPLRRLPDRFRHNLMLPALDPAERLSTVRCLMTEAAKRRDASPGLTALPVEPTTRLFACPERLASLDTVQRLSLAEIEGYLARTLLRDGDAMSMVHSLEVRPILLDHRLAAFAFALPSAFKLRDGRGKAVFHEALRGVVPDAVLRRRKRGFELPLLRWLSGPLLERADAALASAAAATLFAAPFRQAARKRLRDPQPRDWPLWPCVILAEWTRLHRLGFG